VSNVSWIKGEGGRFAGSTGGGGGHGGGGGGLRGIRARQRLRAAVQSRKDSLAGLRESAAATRVRSSAAALRKAQKSGKADKIAAAREKLSAAVAKAKNSRGVASFKRAARVEQFHRKEAARVASRPQQRLVLGGAKAAKLKSLLRQNHEVLLEAREAGSAAMVARMDKIATAGIQGHVVRMPVYPEIDYNGMYPTCSPLPYPVGSGPSAGCTPTPSLSASDYVSQVLKPAVDYATSKNLYVIIDFHQIDDITKGTSAADAKTFWTDIAPRFANYANVLYEPFNEPMDYSASWSALKPVVQGFIDTIRAGAPNNVIIVPSHSWDQHPGDAASDPPSGSNLMYTAHIYPSNWNATFQAQLATAVAKAPVFISEWGYAASDPNPHAWGTDLRTLVDSDGASWTAWVTDNAWTPSIFADDSLTTLTDFGMLVHDWLGAKASSDWVQ